MLSVAGGSESSAPAGQPGVREYSMKKTRRAVREPGMLKEYDFSKGIRGKYAKRFKSGTNVVVLAPDVARMFPDSESVNRALRALSRISLRHRRKASG